MLLTTAMMPYACVQQIGLSSVDLRIRGRFNAQCSYFTAMLQASSWEHKYLTAQEALTAAQADAERSHKQAAAAAAAAVQKQQKLLEQLSAAEAALADSHSSAQKLLQQLGESQASHWQSEQALEGEEAAHRTPRCTGFTHTRVLNAFWGILVLCNQIMCSASTAYAVSECALRPGWNPLSSFTPFLCLCFRFPMLKSMHTCHTADLQVHVQNAKQQRHICSTFSLLQTRCWQSWRTPEGQSPPQP